MLVAVLAVPSNDAEQRSWRKGGQRIENATCPPTASLQQLRLAYLVRRTEVQETPLRFSHVVASAWSGPDPRRQLLWHDTCFPRPQRGPFQSAASPALLQTASKSSPPSQMLLLPAATLSKWMLADTSRRALKGKG
jgi:hypothetical protein